MLKIKKNRADPRPEDYAEYAKYHPNQADYELPSIQDSPQVIKLSLYTWDLQKLEPLPHPPSYRRRMNLHCTKCRRYNPDSTLPLHQTNLRSHWINNHPGKFAEICGKTSLDVRKGPGDKRSIVKLVASNPMIT